MPQRRFWQLHLSTLLLMTFVASGLMWANAVGRTSAEYGIHTHRGTPVLPVHGWPATMCYQLMDLHSGEPLVPTVYYWNTSNVIINIGTNLVILLFAVIVCEFLIRRREARAPMRWILALLPWLIWGAAVAWIEVQSRNAHADDIYNDAWAATHLIGFPLALGSSVALAISYDRIRSVRFSLTTLLLIAFWLAALMLVWVRREPWALDRQVTFDEPPDTGFDSPDGTRRCHWMEGMVLISAKGSYDHVLFNFTNEDDNSPGRPLGFLDDNAFVFLRDGSTYLCFRRRFPEWWWGHLYRPEVWLALALSGALLSRAAKAWRSAQS